MQADTSESLGLRARLFYFYIASRIPLFANGVYVAKLCVGIKLADSYIPSGECTRVHVSVSPWNVSVSMVGCGVVLSDH